MGSGVRIEGRLVVKGKGRVRIGSDCTFCGFSGKPNMLITFCPDAEIRIGDGCILNGAVVTAQRGVTFGERCLIADARFLDTDFHSARADRMWNPDSVAGSAPIHIGTNVWVASEAAVLKGVTIGENSVVGFRSVVRRSVPANCIVIGNPERIVGAVEGVDAEVR